MENGKVVNVQTFQMDDSAWNGFGDECESDDYQREHPYFCNVEE